jgi:very-short-patch-repair endonuclease
MESLRNRQLDGFKFRRQHMIGRFIVDFCCAEQRLIVEIDGLVHDQQADSDQARTEALQTAGYQVIRYTNDQIDQDIDTVLADLRQALARHEHNDNSPSPAAAGEGAGGEGQLMHGLLAILALIILLAACAPPTPPTPTETPISTPTRAPTPVLEPTIEEIDPTIEEVDPSSTPGPTPTPAPIGDCPASFNALDPVDRALFEDVASINDVFLNRRFVIWDDKYRFDNIPMLLARRDHVGVPPLYGFLFNWSSGVLENGGMFNLPSFLDLGTVYCVSPLPRAQDLISVPARLRQPTHASDLPITITTPGGQQTDDDSVFLLIYGDRSEEPRMIDRAADPRATERWTSNAVRAAFGRWQLVEGSLDGQFRLAEPERNDQVVPSTPQQVALALLEQRIPAAALRANGDDERLARQLVAVRQLRLASSPRISRAEQFQEQRDGTAAYVGYRFALAAGQTQLQSWPDRLLAGYAGENAPDLDSGATPIGDYMREERPALSGAAIGLLLDAATLPWRGQMAQGTTPFDILAAAFPVAESERDTLVAQTQARFGYDQLVARAEAARR